MARIIKQICHGGKKSMSSQSITYRKRIKGGLSISNMRQCFTAFQMHQLIKLIKNDNKARWLGVEQKIWNQNQKKACARKT